MAHMHYCTMYYKTMVAHNPQHSGMFPLKDGVGGLSTGGVGGGGYSPLPPPPRPKNKSTETDPQASEVTWTQNSAKNENGISASREFRKIIICHAVSEKNWDHFQCSKILLPLARHLEEGRGTTILELRRL